MLMESLAWLRARSDRVQRKLGYVTEAVAINARYARCQSAWQTHLDHSQQFISEAIKHCGSHRKVLILGAGNCLDVPLAQLSSAFQRVLLVDAVKLAQMDALLQPYKNIDYVLHDITEINNDLVQCSESEQLQRLSQQTPRRFLDDNQIDLVVSLNLLSQLPLLPMRYLRARQSIDDKQINAFGLDLMRAHCRYLQQFRATKVMIYDAEQWQEDPHGQRHDPLSLSDWLQHELPITTAQQIQEWQWTVAPAGEQSALSTQHRVQALLFVR